jgi:hypothetical protein
MLHEHINERSSHQQQRRVGDQQSTDYDPRLRAQGPKRNEHRHGSLIGTLAVLVHACMIRAASSEVNADE